MSSTTSSPTTTGAETPLATGQYNTRKGSTVDAHVAPEPMGFLRLDTGEVIFVPAADSALVNNEFDRWNRLMHEQLLANQVLSLADERLNEIAIAKGRNPRSVPADVEAEARKCQGWAIQWREEATEAVRKELQRLDKLDGAGKKLIELVPLVEKAGDKPYMVKKDDKNGQWQRDKLDLKQAWSISGAAGLRSHFKQLDRYSGVGPLRVMGSDKLKANWPKFKDAKSTKWAEVYKKDERTGKRVIDRKKMRTYLGEQVQKVKLSSSDFVKLEISNVGTLGPEALANWNERAHTSKEGVLKYGDTQIADIDFSAEAAAMRYYSGGSLKAEIAPLQGNVCFKAEGSAEVAFAEGKMDGHLYLPSKAGLMLYYLDLEQFAEMSAGKAVDTARYDMGAIRLVVGAELKGLLGVSLAGEVSIGVAMKDVEATDVDGGKKPGRMPAVRGSRKKPKRTQAADVTGKGSEWKNTAGLSADVQFFAGVKGGLELKGALEWRNPHSADKKFEILASVAPELQGMAGLAGELKLAVEYVDGIFRVTAHAGLCFGLGAEGTVTLAVGAKQLASFLSWIYYSLLHVQFKNLKYISIEAFSALKQLGYLLVCEAEAVEKYFGTKLQRLGELCDDIDEAFSKARACLALADRIIANPTQVRFSTPESKGMLIYQLTRHSAANWAQDGYGLLDDYLPRQRQAVLQVLEQTTLKADLKNVIQHIGPRGEKGDLRERVRKLEEFFAVEGPRGMDVPGTRTRYEKDFERMQRIRGIDPAAFRREVAMNGDFTGWYEDTYAALREDHTRGFPAEANSSLAYALQEQSRDHPLFASVDGGFYDTTA
ncbi:hypothetical protein OPU71_00010 [Niveibacterium sp. 24ML]|uniref:hypothetical protein n=1 Tax=Niveibacterium sp. 24ML TaxID=2985512 RepID=UPI00226EEE15|nr:hypothetical protein [Niveibacterium sp. 24ML]MCX9154501.1 hypothetical protein [Niveibacterium sp. 24ML]